MEPLLTAEEVAEYLNVKPSTIYQMKKRGQIPFVSIARSGVRFRSEDVKEYVENNLQKNQRQSK